MIFSQSSPKKKLMLIGIAGTQKDFLLSLPVLKCFLHQGNYIKNTTEIILKQYYHIPCEMLKKKSEEILSDIENVKPDIIGFSSYVWNIDAVKLISDRVKQQYKHIEIILGGPEIAREDIVDGKYDNSKVDFLIFGEGEKPLLGLLKSLIEPSRGSLQEIKGLACRRTDSLFCNKEPDFIENLDELPSPYLEGYAEDILSRPAIHANIETQRGCSFRCAYCFYHKNFPIIRYRDENTVIDEIDYLYAKGITNVRILDANFLSDKDFAKRIIIGLIERRIKISLFFEILPHFIDDEISNLFGQYIRISPKNEIAVGMGIQTINQESLDIIRRKIPLRYFERAFNLLQKQNVMIKTDIILGLPRETKETYFKTIEYICEKMRYGTNHLTLHPLRILPGTDMVEIAKEEHLLVDKRDDSHFVYSTLDMTRKDMIHCLRINAAAHRLLNCNRRIRDLYFDFKDTLKVTNIELLEYFANQFYQFLKDKDVDYVKEDFPNAEMYYMRRIDNDIPDEWIMFHNNLHLLLYKYKPYKFAKLYIKKNLPHLWNMLKLLQKILTLNHVFY